MSLRLWWVSSMALVLALSSWGCDRGGDSGGQRGGTGGAAPGTGQTLQGGSVVPDIAPQELARRDIRGLLDNSRGYYERWGRFYDSAPLTPPEPPCGPNGQPLDASQWSHPTWRALRFHFRDPHHYSYQYDVIGTGGPGTRALATAIGDLDCDGVRGTFQQSILVRETADSDVNIATGELTSTNPDE